MAERRLPLLFLFFALFLHRVECQLDISSCGASKGCLFAPSDCKPGTASCQLSFSYVVEGDSLLMELEGKPPSGGYIAVGFSYDNAMGNDSLSVCYGSQQQSLGYNQGRQALLLTSPGQSLLGWSSSNGQTSCRLRRSLSSTDPRVFPLNSSYNLLLAYGPMNSQNLGYHQMNKWVLPRQDLTAYRSTGDSDSASSSPSTSASPSSASPPSASPASSFSSSTNSAPPTTTPRGSSAVGEAAVSRMDTPFQQNQGGLRSHDDQLRIAHGICMSLAWMVFLSTGILLARFFRDHLATSTPCGLKMWFHGHRIFNTIGIALTICGFVCIFVANDWRWSGPRAFQSQQVNQSWGSIHSMVGLLSCVIAWAQPLNAVFRCHPGQTGRFVFNWIHRFFGFGAWLLAAAAIIIACLHFDMMFSNRTAAFGLFIAFLAAFGVCLIILQLLQFCGWCKSRGLGDVEIVRADGSTLVVPTSSTSGTRTLTTLLFLPYLVVAIGTSVAMAVLIGLKPAI